MPKNERAYRSTMFLGQRHVNEELGQQFDPLPFTGTVVRCADGEPYALLQWGHEALFCVIARELLDRPIDEGELVKLTPYARRDFQGQRIDQPASGLRAVTHVIGGRTIKLPVPPAQNHYLAVLIDQLESMDAPDGIRKLTHALVDASATAYALVDPHEDDRANDPAFTFHVASKKFVGRLTISYSVGLDTYKIVFFSHEEGAEAETLTDIYVDQMAEIIIDKIDDGLWRRIIVTKPPLAGLFK